MAYTHILTKNKYIHISSGYKRRMKNFKIDVLARVDINNPPKFFTKIKKKNTYGASRGREAKVIFLRTPSTGLTVKTYVRRAASHINYPPLLCQRQMKQCASR